MAMHPGFAWCCLLALLILVGHGMALVDHTGEKERKVFLKARLLHVCFDKLFCMMIRVNTS